MMEAAVRLAGDRVAAIVTTPVSGGRRACVLVNAGVVPKHGPFRLYTELARRLADHDYTTVRFDLGGLGDSTADGSHAPLAARTLGEIAAAVDHVCATPRVPGAVVIGGLCSGAEDAFRYAEIDARVTSVVLVDPFAYRTTGWYPRDLVRRAVGKLLVASGAWQPPLVERGARLVDYAYMRRAEAARILAALVGRRVRVHFIYTGGSDVHFNHPGQVAAMFPQLDLREFVTVDHLPGIEHTQLLGEDRALLVDTIAARLAW
jgi:pimeloyl-ACP methyl ester carboxylesterase